MLESRTNVTALCGATVAMFLAFIAGYGPGTPIPLAAVPANLGAAAGNAVVTLTWTASSGATSYNVKSGTTSGGNIQNSPAPPPPGIRIPRLPMAPPNYYVVPALNAAGESANSAQVSATPVTPSAPPPAPTGLTATAENSQVSFTWSASSGATGYVVCTAIGWNRGHLAHDGWRHNLGPGGQERTPRRLLEP